MAVEPLPAPLRRERIASLVQERGFVRVAELSRIFRTTPVTIRTDLDELVSRDLVRRVHGGAVSRLGPTPPVGTSPEDPLAAERATLAAAAAGKVEEGQTVVLAGAPVTRMVARALAHRAELDNVTVLTNDLHIALELQPAIPRLTVILTGGTLRADSPDLGDPLGGLLLAGIAADMTIVGCSAISAERGLTESNVGSVEAVRRLVDAGGYIVVAADATQVGASSPARIVPAKQIDLLITASQADSDEIDRLRELGVDIELVE